MNVIITAGGISEKIDNVRKITNSSSGKLGMIIAEEFSKIKNVDKIYYVCSKKCYKPKNNNIEIILVDNTIDLKNKIEILLKNNKIDYFIHSMAVADYMLDYVTNTNYIKEAVKNGNIKNCKKYNDSKISSYEEDLVIVLKKTPKIISMIKNISPNTYLVGFKLLDNVPKDYLITVAKSLRDKNKCNLVIANDIKYINNNIHKAYIIDENDEEIQCNTKGNIAKALVKKIFYN